MLRRKQLVEGDQLCVAHLVGAFQRLFIVGYVEVGRLNILVQAVNERCRYLVVEKVGGLACQPSLFKIVELLYQLLVLCRQPFEGICVEDEPLVGVGYYKVFYFQVFMFDALTQVVKRQLTESLGIDLVAVWLLL